MLSSDFHNCNFYKCISNFHNCLITSETRKSCFFAWKHYIVDLEARESSAQQEKEDDFKAPVDLEEEVGDFILF